MSAARNAAQGKPCLIRLPNICNGNPETTVLAHYRLAGTCGIGMKPDDEQAAWACSDCHAETDRRTRKLETEYVRWMHCEGVLRTQYEMRREPQPSNDYRWKRPDPGPETLPKSLPPAPPRVAK